MEKRIIINSNIKIYKDLYRILNTFSEGDSLKTRQVKLQNYEIPDEIDSSYKRIYTFINENSGPLRLFCQRSKKDGCILGHIVGSSILFQGEKSFGNLAIRILMHTARNLRANILFHLDKYNDFTMEIYERICSDKKILVKYLDGIGYTAQFQREFLQLMELGDKLIEKLLDFLYQVYKLLEKEYEQFETMITKKEAELEENIRRDGIESLYKPMLACIQDIENMEKWISKYIVSVCIYAPIGIDVKFDRDEDCAVIFVGVQYHMNREIYTKYYDNLYVKLMPFGHHIRIQLLNQLQKIPMQLNQLVKQLQIDKSTVSYHLDVLYRQQYVIKRQVHEKVFYYLNKQGIEKIIEQIEYYGGEKE